MNKYIGTYSSLVFDCDGVILNSNHIKTEAFRVTSLPWGDVAAADLVAYHIANGGVSRHRKFTYFLETILPKRVSTAVPGFDRPSLDELLFNYAQLVHGGLMSCCVAEGLEELRLKTPDSNWCIVSGGDQAELREIFSARNLDHFFDGGIYGSPDNKDTILAREMALGNIRSPALFIGDSRYDHEASKRAGLDFVFVSGWSDVEDWKSYTSSNRLDSVNKIADLLL
ncbi:HAD family hydrolase [Synechococcus sp. BMK-MC-1]|uniref:HAD family hydrolase n=1 Tax=Synechococcus sp. BMK-MC-1 TaxID=1442551 RepID=UPI001646A6D9|nr:HAD hydrolase-like protein [Synechococcus sp. BMK-MC-1]QNI66422.1 haloacid dehalogenase-like hydrolase family protein [Synechococcus sp. BMK-MC-1]